MLCFPGGILSLKNPDLFQWAVGPTNIASKGNIIFTIEGWNKHAFSPEGITIFIFKIVFCINILGRLFKAEAVNVSTSKTWSNKGNPERIVSQKLWYYHFERINIIFRKVQIYMKKQTGDFKYYEIKGRLFFSS